MRKQQSLIKSVTHADGTVETPQEGSSTRVIDESVADQVKNAMESVAEGYSKVVNVKGYRIAAKTGTAEVAGSDGRLTSIVADFAGMIPADNPRFAITVIMKDPQGTYGGMTAGPVFAKIGEFLMIVVLVLQLATSAGTYPLQLAPKIYQVISPWLPMTYGLKMLRETIGLNGAILPEAILFVVIIALFTFMLSFFKKFSRFA